jgi:hypothetical protein
VTKARFARSLANLVGAVCIKSPANRTDGHERIQRQPAIPMSRGELANAKAFLRWLSAQYGWTGDASTSFGRAFEEPGCSSIIMSLRSI